MSEIKRRECFQVSNRIFRTKRAAAKLEAWHRIVQKYGDVEAVMSVDGLECVCDDCFFGYEDCPVHDRRTGYFAKMREEIMRQILEECKEV